MDVPSILSQGRQLVALAAASRLRLQLPAKAAASELDRQAKRSGPSVLTQRRLAELHADRMADLPGRTRCRPWRRRRAAIAAAGRWR